MVDGFVSSGLRSDTNRIFRNWSVQYSLSIWIYLAQLVVSSFNARCTDALSRVLYPYLYQFSIP